MNCQMGRGRSTLVTILVYLIFKKLGLLSKVNENEMIRTLSFSPPAPSPRPPKRNKYLATPMKIKKSASNPNMTRAKSKAKSRNIDGVQDFDDAQIEKRGDYEVIYRILRVLSNGKLAKQEVDAAIEECGSLYNLKQKMAACRLMLENSENDDEKELAAYSNKVILSRYCTLIAFAAFLHSNSELNAQYDFKRHSFSKWLTSVPSLEKIRANILKLSYDDLMQQYSAKLPSKSMNTMLILNRIGSVLSANTILKADIAQNGGNDTKASKKLKSVKFRYLPEIGVATCSQPPSSVIETILKTKLKMECLDNDEKEDEAIWIDLREEPVLYIRSRPYVVRNYNIPYRRLPEFDNLAREHLNDIAKRLKHDIHQEAVDNDDKLLTHYEDNGQLKENIIRIDATQSNELQTADQIFDALRNKGYPIRYQKVPFNPRNRFEFVQLDTLGKVISNYVQSRATIIFSCRQFCFCILSLYLIVVQWFPS